MLAWSSVPESAREPFFCVAMDSFKSSARPPRSLWCRVWERALTEKRLRALERLLADDTGVLRESTVFDGKSEVSSHQRKSQQKTLRHPGLFLEAERALHSLCPDACHVLHLVRSHIDYMRL